MKRFVLRTTKFTSVALMLAMAGPAAAQATRTWVSGVGNDANPCSRTAPCKTFAGAIVKTAAGGEISVLDPGGFGGVTINKNISIVAEGGEGGILGAATTGVLINGAGVVASLRGLIIEGAGTGLHGVRFFNGGALHISNSQIRGFSSASAGAGNGVIFAPSTAAELTIVDSIISDNGAGGQGGGVVIRPVAGGAAKVLIERTQIVNNLVGLVVDGSTSTTDISVTLKDSAVDGNNGFGVNVTASNVQAPTAVNVEGSSISNNTQAAMRTQGANASINVGRSNVTGNGGVAFNTVSGAISSYGDNHVADNGPGGSVPTPIAPQ